MTVKTNRLTASSFLIHISGWELDCASPCIGRSGRFSHCATNGFSNSPEPNPTVENKQPKAPKEEEKVWITGPLWNLIVSHKVKQSECIITICSVTSGVFVLYTVRITADIICSQHHCFVFCKTQLFIVETHRVRSTAIYLSVHFHPKQTRFSKYHFDCCWCNCLCWHWVSEKVDSI